MSKRFLPQELPKRKAQYSPTDYMLFSFSWFTWVHGSLVAAMLILDRDGKTIMKILAWMTDIFFVTWFIALAFLLIAVSIAKP